MQKIPSDLKPIVQFPFFFTKKNSCTFLVGDKKVILEGPERVISNTLLLCDGFNSFKEIEDKIDQRDKPDFFEIFSILLRKNIIVDSSRQYIKSVLTESNPPIFLREERYKDLVSLKRQVNTNRKAKNFREILRLRTSTRAFDKKKMNRLQLINFLKYVFELEGIKTYPSAGSLYLVKSFVWMPDEGGKLFIYDIHKAKLQTICDISSKKMQYLIQYADIQDVSMVLILSYNLDLISRKYDNRAYRFAMLESGHIMQNGYLFASKENIGVCEYGGFFDEELAKTLKLNFPSEIVTSVMLVGKKSKGAYYHLMDRVFDYVIKEQKLVDAISIKYEELDGKKVPYITSLSKLSSDKNKDPMLNSGVAQTESEAAIKTLAESYEREIFRFPKKYKLHKPGDKRNYLTPEKVYPLSEEQYALYNISNNERFDRQKKFEYVSGLDMVNQSIVHTPVELVFYETKAKESEIRRNPMIYSTSNGCAVHVDYDKAVQGALFELVERDALMLTWMNKLKPMLIPEKYHPPIVKEVVGSLRKQKVQVKILDISIDSIPVVLTVMYKKDAGFYYFCTGAACSLDYEASIEKSFAETLPRFLYQLNEKDFSKRYASYIKGVKEEKVKSIVDHEPFYFNEKNFCSLRWILSGNEVGKKLHKTMRFSAIIEKYRPVIFDITEKGSLFHSIRIISSDLVPISFGHGRELYLHPRVKRFNTSGKINHSPHFFA